MSGRTINHFMWGYQPHFRVLTESFAERVFHLLDPRLSPEMFLVGILNVPGAKAYPACVEPEVDCWIQSADFNSVPEVAKTLLASYPEGKMFQSHPLAQKSQDDALFKRSIQDAIAATIDGHPLRDSSLRHFVSSPVKVGDYLVSAVLSLQREVVESYAALTKSSAALHKYRTIKLSVSLIDATAEAFLAHVSQELSKPDPGHGGNDQEAEEIIRIAGNDFCKDLAWRADPDRIEGIHKLFRACTSVSSLLYETSEGAGRLVLARRGHPSVEPVITFLAPTDVSRHRAVRKLFQLASRELMLHSDAEQVFGLVTVGAYDEAAEDLFTVRMLGHHHWEITHADKTLMRVRYGLPYLPRRSFDEEKLRMDLPRFFKMFTEPDVDRLVALIHAAEEEPHGTLLVITEAAASEAQRLSSQGTPIAPCTLTPELLRHVTPIDGAIILSPDGVCHGIATILDGRATQGDPGRGARFNSALRYVEATSPCLAVVISEDGGIDFVPNPRPAVRRSKIDRLIEELSTMANAPGPVSRRKYNGACDALDAHRFYLRQADCDAINPIIESLEKALREQDKAQVWIVRSPFAPHTDFNEQLYYAEESKEVPEK